MNILLYTLYSLPAILLVLFCYEVSLDKKNVQTDNIAIFIITGVVAFCYIFLNCEEDIYLLTHTNLDFLARNVFTHLKILPYGWGKFTLVGLSKICFLNLIILFGKIRFSKDYKTIVLEIAVSIALVVAGFNYTYILLFLFTKFNLTFGNNSKMYDTIIHIAYFTLEVIFFQNSYIFCLILLIALLKNCKKIEQAHIFIYDRYKWMEVEKNMKEITNIIYLFIYLDEKLSPRETKEFLLFLDHITYNNNVIRVHNDLFAVAFSEINKSFGYSDDVITNTIKSEMNTTEELVKARLQFPIIEEIGKIYSCIMFKSSDYYYYRKFREEHPDKEELFSSKSMLIDKLYKD